MAKIPKIKLEKEQKEQAIKAIKEYFENERDEEIGELASAILLDFITEEIAPYYYNQAIADAQKLMNKKVEDLYELVV